MTAPSQSTTNTINTAVGAPKRKLTVNPAQTLCSQRALDSDVRSNTQDHAYCTISEQLP